MKIKGIEFNVTMKVAEIELNKEDYDAMIADDKQSHAHRMERKKRDMMEDLLCSSKIKDALSDYITAAIKQSSDDNTSDSKSAFDVDVESQIERIHEEVDEFKKNFEKGHEPTPLSDEDVEQIKREIEETDQKQMFGDKKIKK